MQRGIVYNFSNIGTYQPYLLQKFSLSSSRNKNIAFYEEYSLDSVLRTDLFISLNVLDASHFST